MTHLSEERNIPAPVEAVWAIVADTKQWPRFFATPREIGKLRFVEYLDGATADGPDVKRRMAFVGLPAWEEQATRWRENDSIHWLGIKNPGQKYWAQQMELIPGKGFVTLRWDVFYELGGVARSVKKGFKGAMEDIMLSSLQRIERLAVERAAGDAATGKRA